MIKKKLSRKDFVEWGRKAGEVTKKKMPKDHYSKIGKKGAKSRWSKK